MDGNEVMDGSVYTDEQGLPMVRIGPRSFLCDCLGHKITERGILRLPTYSERAWAHMPNQDWRKRAWQHFWDHGAQDNVVASASSCAAASLLAVSAASHKALPVLVGFAARHRFFAL